MQKFVCDCARDRVIDLAAVVQREVEDYARGDTWKAVTYPVSDVARQTYAVVVVPDLPRPFKARIVVMARIVDDMVIIDEDTTDKPLVHELVRAGIPREKIICLYLGELLPEKSPDKTPRTAFRDSFQYPYALSLKFTAELLASSASLR